MNEGSALAAFARAVQRPESEVDLGAAALAIALMEYPTLDVQGYLDRMDGLAAEVRQRAIGDQGVYRLLACLNYVLFREQGFRGNRGDYYDPRNSFMNEVMDRRLGIPISLSVLYMEVARRAGLALWGVGFPGHFLLKYQGSEEIFLDPFIQGEIRSREELQGLLDAFYRGKVAFQPDFLVPVTKHEILGRMLNNLKALYLQRGDLMKALSVVERLIVLEPNFPEEVRDRGLLYAQLECLFQAVADLESYLKLSPQAEDAREIRERIAQLKGKNPCLH